MRGKTLVVDLESDRPQITCEGEIVAGVTKAEIVLTPDELPTLTITLCIFEVIGDKLPHGWPYIPTKENE